MKKILYVIDNKVILEEFIKFIRRRKDKDYLTFCICPITIDNDLVESVGQRLLEYGKVEKLLFINEFHKNAFSFKNKFIKFLSDFSSGKGKIPISLREYFKYPFKDFSLWWLSLIGGKDTVRNQSYHNFIRFITIVKFYEVRLINEVYVDIDNEPLKRAILRNKYNKKITLRVKPKNDITINLVVSFIKASGYAVFFAIRKCVLFVMFRKDIKKRVSILKNTKFLFITFFPFADKQLLKKEIYKSSYFGPLQDSIERRYKDKISWIGILQGRSKLNINEKRLAKKINAWKYNFFLPEEMVSFRDMVSTYLVFLYISLRFLTKMPYLSRNFLFDGKREFNIWDIFREEWVSSFSGSFLMASLLYYRVFSNITSTIKDKAVIIYPAELHPWENALNIASKRNKNIKTVAIQHTSVPLLFLSFFNAPCDIEDNGAIDNLPLPDYLATSGNAPSRLFIDSGWPKEKIFELGAIRYHGLSQFLEHEIDWERRAKRVVVALSYARREIEELMLMLWQAFRDIDSCDFVIKPHPGYSMQEFINIIGTDYAISKFKIDIETPLEDLLISSRAVIVTGSTASINGVACQCPVVIPRLSCTIDMNPLSEICDGLAKYATNKEELVTIIKAIMDSKESPISFNKFKSFINGYFTIVDNEDEYFMRMEKELLDK